MVSYFPFEIRGLEIFKSYPHCLQPWPENGTFHLTESIWTLSGHYPLEQHAPRELSVMMEILHICTIQYGSH